MSLYVGVPSVMVCVVWLRLVSTRPKTVRMEVSRTMGEPPCWEYNVIFAEAFAERKRPHTWNGAMNDNVPSAFLVNTSFNLASPA